MSTHRDRHIESDTQKAMIEGDDTQKAIGKSGTRVSDMLYRFLYDPAVSNVCCLTRIPTYSNVCRIQSCSNVCRIQTYAAWQSGRYGESRCFTRRARDGCTRMCLADAHVMDVPGAHVMDVQGYASLTSIYPGRALDTLNSATSTTQRKLLACRAHK